MRKSLILLLCIFMSAVIAGLFGSLHDQITYTICPEYYTRFKFIMFGLADEIQALHMTHPRLEVAKVGLMATWWMGLILGIIEGLFSLAIEGHRVRVKAFLQAIGLTLAAVLVAETVAGLYGWQYAADHFSFSWVPSVVKDRKAYITVGFIHNFAYAGAIPGLIASCSFLMIKGARQKRQKSLRVA